MRQDKLIIFAFLLICLLTISGCSSPAENESDLQQSQTSEAQHLIGTIVAQTQAAQHQVETIVAQTLAAMPEIDKDMTPSEATATQVPTETHTATMAPTETPTLPNTAVSAVPMVQVTVPTNCRSGPGKVFGKVSVFDVGKSVEVIARNSDSTYWVVNNPAGSGVCWVWGNYAIVSGSTSGLPVWDSPPTPTPQAGVTATATGVSLKVSVPTNCRVGPGKAFEIVSVMRPGKTARVIARHATADFWVIENPEGSGSCWVWGEYATLSGSTANVPMWATPPTPTPNLVTLKVSVDTNCRTGPGKAYEVVTIFRIGLTADVIARNAAETYWVIRNPAGSGHCWVWGEYATLIGPKAELPVWAPPPTPTP